MKNVIPFPVKNSKLNSELSEKNQESKKDQEEKKRILFSASIGSLFIFIMIFNSSLYEFSSFDQVDKTRKIASIKTQSIHNLIKEEDEKKILDQLEFFAERDVASFAFPPTQAERWVFEKLGPSYSTSYDKNQKIVRLELLKNFGDHAFTLHDLSLFFSKNKNFFLKPNERFILESSTEQDGFKNDIYKIQEGNLQKNTISVKRDSKDRLHFLSVE